MTALLTDQYELHMAVSYLRNDMREDATFSLFVRHLPRQRGFLVCCGLHDALRVLEQFRFERRELAYLVAELGLDAGTIRELADLRFTGDVWAVPEGHIVFANEPLLEVTAPIAQAQLVETILLNEITYQTAIASKAARCRLATRKTLADFSFRRTHGAQAAIAAARASAIVGFASTSNVEAARRFGLITSGTMAHSYIQAFPDEPSAFRAFAREHRDAVTFLVDTYDPVVGVTHAIEVIRDLELQGSLAIRLDSGDLATLTKRAREMLDQAGLPCVRIVASGGLDEFSIEALETAGAPIDSYGVGTAMGVSQDAPTLDSVYKLVEYGGRPVIKLSSGKTTAPGRKQIHRSESASDTIGLRDELLPAGSTALLEPVMIGGHTVGSPEPIARMRARFESDLVRLPDGARRIRDPEPPEVDVSPALARLTSELADRYRR